jgi:hypothetical protein
MMDKSVSAYWKFQLGSLGWLLAGPFVLLPLALLRRWKERASKLPQYEHATLPEWQDEWAWRYCNEDLGVVPPALNNGVPYMPWAPDWLRAYVWCAFRNPTNGMKVIEVLKYRATVTHTWYGAIVRSGPYWCCWIGRWWRFGWLVNVDADTGYLTWPIFENTKGCIVP